MELQAVMKLMKSHGAGPYTLDQAREQNRAVRIAAQAAHSSVQGLVDRRRNAIMAGDAAAVAAIDEQLPRLRQDLEDLEALTNVTAERLRHAQEAQAAQEAVQLAERLPEVVEQALQAEQAAHVAIGALRFAVGQITTAFSRGSMDQKGMPRLPQETLDEVHRLTSVRLCRYVFPA